MSWTNVRKTNFNNLKKLADFLEIDLSRLGLSPRFSLNLPKRIADKIEKGTLSDPLLRQFVPLPEENLSVPGFTQDPVQDSSFCKSSKLLQKYEGRALLLTNSSCAMHCRFCFRQNFDYNNKNVFEEELALLRNDPSLQEIILSGGDPLSLNNSVLAKLISDLSSIEHIKLIRFHTRFPIGIPERIDTPFLQLLENCTKQCIFIIHANHPKELDQDVLAALKSIQKLGIPVLLHTVLLRGVNDDLATLKSLLETCIQHGIMPYYLNQLDKVAGAAHFEVPEEKGLELIQALQRCLPGYAIPTYAKEIPGEMNKTPILPIP